MQSFLVMIVYKLMTLNSTFQDHLRSELVAPTDSSYMISYLSVKKLSTKCIVSEIRLSENWWSWIWLFGFPQGQTCGTVETPYMYMITNLSVIQIISLNCIASKIWSNKIDDLEFDLSRALKVKTYISNWKLVYGLLPNGNILRLFILDTWKVHIL